MNELRHYGILGMKWGVRRFQNKNGSLTPAGKKRYGPYKYERNFSNRRYIDRKGYLTLKGLRRYQNEDGSLTPEGRKKIGLDDYEREHSKDISLKKGTKATRVVSTSEWYEHALPEFGGSAEKGKKYVDGILAKEKKYERKYVSIDGVRNSGRANGEDFYLSWFTDTGWAPDNAYLTTYELKKDARVASGKQVVESLLKEVGATKVEDLLKENKDIYSLTLEYTRKKELFNKVNDWFAKKGYDGVEDVNDPDTDLPVIFLNSSKTLGNMKSVKSGKEAIDDLIKRTKAEVEAEEEAKKRR